jgi:hypothetical protein
MDLPLGGFLFTLAVAAILALSVLGALARSFLHEIALFRLKHEAARLKAEHERRLADMKNGRFESAEISAAA